MQRVELVVCEGTYRRDNQAVWRYHWGSVVPGAADVLVAELLAVEPQLGCEELLRRFREPSSAERAWIRGEPVDPTCLPVASRRGRAPHLGDLVASLRAPELDAHLLLTVDDIARELRVERATVESYRRRGYLPPAPVRCGRTPLWTAPVVRHWIASRPGAGRPRT
ncbi:MAG: helix-turn-helix domain-containing protein [Nitriliruptoraceae bacterium]|nr:helix-turn-helix domain-containing protein [Nitriliruptoraceae bacterium]